ELVQSTRSKTLEEVAELSETSAAYLSQVRNRLKDSKTGTPKEMGRKVAEKLRLAFDKPPGWMDNLDMQGEVTMPSPVVMSAMVTSYAPNIIDTGRQIGAVPKISWVKAGEYAEVEDFYEPGDADEWLPCPVRHGPRT